MTTTAPRDDHALREELGERRREAWDAYRDSLRDLKGRDYEQTEAESWDRLQHELSELEDEHAERSQPVASGEPER